MLEIKDLNVHFGVIHALKGISLTVNNGEIVTLIGANGAGKTTILNTVSGLLRSRTGSIEFAGQSIFNTPAHKMVKEGLAHVPEGRRIFQQMTVEENLDMGAFIRGGKDMDETKEMVCRVVDLPAPLAPMRVTISPSLTSNDTSLMA